MFLPFDDTPGRLAAYQYLEELVVNRRILEIGCGEGMGLGRLLALGAREVVGIDGSTEQARAALGRDRDGMRIRSWQPPLLPFATDSFDLVVLPRAGLAVEFPTLLEEIPRVLAPGGGLVLRSPSTDHPRISEGLSYGELLDLAEPLFEEVRVIGQCPFVGYSLVELTEDEQEPEVQLDGGLLAGEVEEVVAYVVICTEPADQVYPYGVIQIPSSLEPSSEDELPEAEPERELELEPEREPEPEPEPELEPDDLQSYTDHAGGRLSRWRWPNGTR